MTSVSAELGFPRDDRVGLLDLALPVDLLQKSIMALLRISALHQAWLAASMSVVSVCPQSSLAGFADALRHMSPTLWALRRTTLFCDCVGARTRVQFGVEAMRWREALGPASEASGPQPIRQRLQVVSSVVTSTRPLLMAPQCPLTLFLGSLEC